MTTQSNIRIVSNVYPVTTARRHLFDKEQWGGVSEDSTFRTKVRGRTALRKLADLLFATEIDGRVLRQQFLDTRMVEKWQIDIYWDQEGAGNCVDCAPGEKPFGLIRRGKTFVVENRCKKVNCPCR